MSAAAALFRRLRQALASVKDSNGLTMSREHADELRKLLKAAEQEHAAGPLFAGRAR